MILYPTETVYGLGVNPFDPEALEKLYTLKGREIHKAVSWLVRDIADIERYAEVSPRAREIAMRFLPGPLTLVLPARSLPPHLADFSTLSFRISSDPIAQKLIRTYMEEHDAPLTCTSANLSGYPTLFTVPEILAQLGEKAKMITRVIDDGPRSGLASTVVSVVGERVECLREGAILQV